MISKLKGYDMNDEIFDDAPIIACRNCYVNFNLNESVVFKKKSSYCELHEFNTPHGVSIYEISEPSFL